MYELEVNVGTLTTSIRACRVYKTTLEGELSGGLRASCGPLSEITSPGMPWRANSDV